MGGRRARPRMPFGYVWCDIADFGRPVGARASSSPATDMYASIAIEYPIIMLAKDLRPRR